MADERDGVTDPWRRKPPPTEPKEVGAGLPGSDHALDWDIMPDVSHTLRVAGAYGALTIHGARTMEGAAVVFLHRIEESEKLRTVLRQEGFYFCNTEDGLPTGYSFYTPDRTKVLYHPLMSGESPAHTVRKGFSHLVKTLLRACRQDPKFRAHLKTLGIEPLLS